MIRDNTIVRDALDHTISIVYSMHVWYDAFSAARMVHGAKVYFRVTDVFYLITKSYKS